MAKLLVQTLSLMSLFFLVLVHSQSQPLDVTSFRYDTFEPITNGLTYQGDTHVPSSNFLRLTATNPSTGGPMSGSIGRVVYSSPVKFWEISSTREANFETTIRFVSTPASEMRAADGVAFFIAPVGTNIPTDSGGSNLGVYEGSTGFTLNLFAVEFDTYINHEYDPDYRHIGINIESVKSKNVTQFEAGTGELVTARITYNSLSNVISVVATTPTQTSTPLSYVFDLKYVLPEQVQVGISAATGSNELYIGIHNIISWEFTSSLVYPKDESKDSHIRHMI